MPTNCCIALRGGGWLVPFCCCWLGDRAVTNVGFFVWLVWLLHDDRRFGNNNNKTSSVFSFDLISSWFLGFFFVCCWLLALKVAFAKEEARTHNLTLNNLQYEMIQKKGKNYVLIKLCFNYFSTLLHIKKRKKENSI